ncbi:MAG: hypothetical protein R2883_01095 [Caldisericia bacterium]
MEQETKKDEIRTEQELWNDAKLVDKSNFVASLEGKSKGLWISVIVLFIIVVIVFFVIPKPFSPIEHIEYFEEQNTIIATNKNNIFVIDTNKNILLQTLSINYISIDGIDFDDDELIVYDLKEGTKSVFGSNFKSIETIPDDNLEGVTVFKNSHGDRYFFTGEKLDVEYWDDMSGSFTGLDYVRFFSSAVCVQDFTWFADYDRVFPVDMPWKDDRFITPRENQPIKHLSAIDDKLLIIYEDGMLLEIDGDGKITEKKKIEPWTGYNKVSDIEGETIVSGIGNIIQIGNVYDAEPEKTYDLKELTK